MPFRRLDTVPIGIETIIIFLLVFMFFYEQFKNVKEKSLHANYFFWIAIGIMIYLGGTFFFNILANHMNKEDLLVYWTFSYFADILKNLFFTIAIITFGRYFIAHNKKKIDVPYLDMAS